MKVKYIGPNIGATGRTDGKIYTVSEIDPESGALRIIDDDLNDYNYDNDPNWMPGYLYSPTHPRGAALPYAGGRFFIVEDENGQLAKAGVLPLSDSLNIGRHSGGV